MMATCRGDVETGVARFVDGINGRLNVHRFAAFLGVVVLVSPGFTERTARAQTGDWPMWGGSPDRNMVSGETGLPAAWDVKTGKNIKWVTKLGTTTYGVPVIANGKIFVGTNNAGKLRAGIEGDKGVLSLPGGIR